MIKFIPRCYYCAIKTLNIMAYTVPKPTSQSVIAVPRPNCIDMFVSFTYLLLDNCLSIAIKFVYHAKKKTRNHSLNKLFIKKY